MICDMKFTMQMYHSKPIMTLKPTSSMSTPSDYDSMCDGSIRFNWGRLRLSRFSFYSCLQLRLSYLLQFRDVIVTELFVCANMCFVLCQWKCFAVSTKSIAISMCCVFLCSFQYGCFDGERNEICMSYLTSPTAVIQNHIKSYVMEEALWMTDQSFPRGHPWVSLWQIFRHS